MVDGSDAGRVSIRYGFDHGHNLRVPFLVVPTKEAAEKLADVLKDKLVGRNRHQ